MEWFTWCCANPPCTWFFHLQNIYRGNMVLLLLLGGSTTLAKTQVETSCITCQSHLPPGLQVCCVAGTVWGEGGWFIQLRSGCGAGHFLPATDFPGGGRCDPLALIYTHSPKASPLMRLMYSPLFARKHLCGRCASYCIKRTDQKYAAGNFQRCSVPYPAVNNAKRFLTATVC